MGPQVLRVQYGTGYFHGIDGRTGRECIGKVPHRISFVIIYDGIAKIDGISCIGFQCIKEFYNHAASACFYFRTLILRRRDDNLLRSVLQFDVFIEFDGDFLTGVVGRIRLRGSSYELRWSLVIRPTVGSPLAGACIKSNQYK